MDDLCSLYLSAPVLTILITVPLLLLFLRFRGTTSTDRPRLPPGPWRLPFIGSLHHLVGTPLVYRTLADLARRCNAPVMHLQLGELDAVVISSPDAAREVLKTHDVVFASRPMTLTVRATRDHGLGLAFSPYGEQWREIRKLCTQELLSTKRVRSFRRIREDEAARLVAGITAAACAPGEPAGPAVNVTARVATAVIDSALRSMMGERFKRREELLEAVAQIVKIGTGFNLGDLFPSSRIVRAVDGTVRKVQAIHRKLFELVDYAIEQHRERKSAAGTSTDDASEDDLLGVLLRMDKEGGTGYSLDMGTIKSVILALFAGGAESTSATILWTMAELIRNPNVMQKAQAELHSTLQDKSHVTEDDLVNLQYLKLVIKETLRMHPAGPLLLPRECQESCQILEYNVPKGALVLVNAWAIGRDLKYWEKPEVFKPERFLEDKFDFKGADFRYIPFGSGRRICPGTTFALSNLELILATLLFHFDWQLPSGVVPSELDMAEEMGVTVRRKNDLYLHPIVRVPLRDRSQFQI